MKNCISIKLALIITVLAAFCHASDASNRFFRLGTSIGLSYDFLIGKEGNLMDSKDFNGPGFLLAVNTIFNFQDLPALRTGLTYNVRLLKNDVGFTDERLDRDTYVKYNLTECESGSVVVGDKYIEAILENDQYERSIIQSRLEEINEKAAACDNLEEDDVL